MSHEHVCAGRGCARSASAARASHRAWRTDGRQRFGRCAWTVGTDMANLRSLLCLLAIMGSSSSRAAGSLAPGLNTPTLPHWAPTVRIRDYLLHGYTCICPYAAHTHIVGTACTYVLLTCPSGLRLRAPQYNMSLSTVVMPCNTSGPLDPAFFSQFGIVDVDWSHMKAVWCIHACCLRHIRRFAGLVLCH